MKFISLLLLAAGLSWANTNEIAIINDSLDREISKVLNKVDSDAYVLIDVKALKSKQTLPGTPFSIDDMVLRNKDGSPKLASINISVYTRLPELPKELNQLIRSMGRKYGPNPTVKRFPLPDFVLEEKKKRYAELEEFNPDNLASQFFTKNMLLLAIGFFVMFACFFLILSVVRKGASKSLIKSVDNGIDKLSEALENSQSHGPSPAVEAQQESMQQSFQDSASEAENFKEFDQETINALMSDCYWGELDNYAHYIWTQIPIDMRKKLLEENKWLSDYSAFFADKFPKNLGWHNSSYYLSPMPVNHLNNIVLTDLCRKKPALFQSLSPMRQQKLSLSAKEQIQLQQKDNGGFNEALSSELKNLKASEARTIAKKTRLIIETVEQEAEVLAMENLTWEIKKQVPSLGWLLEIDKEKAEDILSRFSAQDLATAWIGPENVLEQVKELIPEKKFGLMSSYLESRQPQRDSSAFLALHEMVMTSYIEEASDDTTPDAA